MISAETCEESVRSNVGEDLCRRWMRVGKQVGYSERMVRVIGERVFKVKKEESGESEETRVIAGERRQEGERKRVEESTWRRVRKLKE